MNATELIAAAGIHGAADIVRVAQEVNLPLPIAATMIQKESRGRNVWGSDGVQTGGTYRKGGPVTRANYEAYRAKRRAGLIGMQGVGPTQLTWWEFQDRADALGGCWDYSTNLRVGFEILRDLQRQYGIREGFRRYNGSGPAAERYADASMALLKDWEAHLGGVKMAKPSGRKTLSITSEGDDVLELQKYLNRVFPAYSRLVEDGQFGPKTRDVIREFQRRSRITDDGVVGPVTWAKLGFS